MLFILAFPTIVSAMSGYDSNVASYLPDRNDNLIRFDNFSRVLYVIHDGWRINQDGDYWITDETMFPGLCSRDIDCRLTTKYPNRRSNIEVFQTLRTVSQL